MPISETPNTVTVGSICLSCALYATKSCPYGNHNLSHTTEFKGDHRGKCSFYMPIVEASVKEIKTAELNVNLYKKIFALSDYQQEKVMDLILGMQNKKLEQKTQQYWSNIYPPKYAEEMVDDVNKTGHQASSVALPKEDKSLDKSEQNREDPAPGSLVYFKKQR